MDRRKTYGDDSFSLTGVKKVGDGALKPIQSPMKRFSPWMHRDRVTIKGTGSAEVSITMAEGTNYLGTSTPAEGSITIEKEPHPTFNGSWNRSTGVQQPEGILGTYEDDFDIIASIQERMVTNCRVRSASMTMEFRIRIRSL